MEASDSFQHLFSGILFVGDDGIWEIDLYIHRGLLGFLQGRYTHLYAIFKLYSYANLAFKPSCSH